MKLRARAACWAANLARWGIVHVLRRAGGNAPGAVALAVDPEVVGSLAQGLGAAAVVTGTNGKTTTTGLLADALAAGGADVVCNRAGNNMESGIAAALVEARPRLAASVGRAGVAPLASLECDELYTARILPAVRPRVMVLLNLFRDQLDRYGEIDHTQDVLVGALASSPETLLVFDADDPLCASVAARVPNPTCGFGICEPTGLEADRISDSRFCAMCNAPLDYEYVHYGQLGAYRCPRCGWERPALGFAVRGVSLGADGYEFDVWDERGAAGKTGAGDVADGSAPDAATPAPAHIRTRYSGLHMVYNVAAAYAAAACMGADLGGFQAALDAYSPASGRMRTFEACGRATRSNLAKNPAGTGRMIAELRALEGRLMAFFLNDNDADGHDVSWIWDVDYERLCELPHEPVAFAGGTRKEDLQVRLKYAGVPARLVDTVEDAIALCAGEPADEPLHVVANYTAFPPVVAELERLEARESGAVAAAGPVARASVAPTLPPAGADVAAWGQALGLERPLRVVHLYPDALNLYGDGGNIASLQRRCEWRGIPVRVDQVRMGDALDLSDADVVLLGGGADRDQLAVAHELQGQRERLAAYVEAGGALLAICGGYQLLGKYYMMGTERIEGLGILDVETTAGATRLIGNMAVDSDVCDTPIVGFENHAGRTVLGPGERPLGRSLVAHTGNNGEDGGEGVLHGGVIGTYLHGPILPKNPGVTDWLISRALERRGFEGVELPALDDACERAAHDRAMTLL